MVGPRAGEAVAASGATEEELVAALSPTTKSNTNGSRIDAASVTPVEMVAATQYRAVLVVDPEPRTLA